MEMTPTARALWDSPEFWRKRIDEQLEYMQQIIVDPSMSITRKEEVLESALRIKRSCIERGFQAASKQDQLRNENVYFHAKFTE